MSTSDPAQAPKPGGRYRLRSFSPWQGTRAAPRSSGASVLIVDGDGVSRRFVELALAGERSLGIPIAVESVQDGARALELLTIRLFDAVVCETDLHDMSGMRLCQLLRQESRLTGMPFVFLSGDDRVETKVVALKSGVDDYIVKPCHPNELAARIVRLIARQRGIRAAQASKSYTLGGDFATMPFPDLVSVLELSRRTGLLSLTTPRAVAEVWFEAGRVTHCQFGNLVGARAFYAIMAESSGQFEFTLDAKSAGAQGTVTESVGELLMESARLLDEQRESAPRQTMPIMEEHAAAGAQPSLRPPGEPARRGTPRLGAQFEMALSDEYTVGELMLWEHEELARWTRSELGRDRLHVHLITGATEGIGALLTLASPPGERWIRSALGAEQKALGLSFFLRQERLLDLVLIDIGAPAWFQGALCRPPAISIVAPAQGHALAISPRSMVQLESLLNAVPPAVLCWVGQDELSPSLKPALSSTLIVSTQGAIGEDGVGLRQLLVRAIRAWSGRLPTPGNGTLIDLGEP